MTHLIDTNVISEPRKVGTTKIDPVVAQWAESLPSEDMWISAITILELELGVRLIERRDLWQGQVLPSWLEMQVKATVASRVLPVDQAVALTYARLLIEPDGSLADCLIASTALAHSLTVVTRNVTHFERYPQAVIVNPWMIRP